MNVMQQFNKLIGERMAASGRMAMIETVGRSSGRRFRTPVGYVQNSDGSLWVGAGRLESHWPKNLLANATCHVRAGSVDSDFTAVELHGEEREAAMTAIHAKYGAPASRVGTGPVFRLVPRGAMGDGSADMPNDGADEVAA